MERDPAISFIVERLRHHLRRVEDASPGLIKRCTRMRAERELLKEQWPEWCYVPLTVPIALLQHDHGAAAAAHSLVGTQIAVAAAWRATQGIYRFDPTLYESLWGSPYDERLPPLPFLRLPEWAVYVITPDLHLADGDVLRGFFAEVFPSMPPLGSSHPTLLLLLDLDRGEAGSARRGTELRPFEVRLGRTVSEEFADQERELLLLRKQRPASAASYLKMVEWMETSMRPVIPCLISLVLYIASRADIRDAAGTDRQPHRARPTATKAGETVIPPSAPTTWDVGYRVGPVLKSSLISDVSRQSAGGTHASPRPHIRRGHWHTYWHGPRTQAASRPRYIEVRWLPPISVRVPSLDSLVPTIRIVQRG